MNLWLQILIISIWVSCANAQELSFFVVPPLAPLAWETPRTLLTSVARNRLSFTEAPQGEVFVKLTCPGSEALLRGVSSEDFGYFSPILHGQGFGVFYHTFTGVLLKGAEVIERIESLKKTRRLSEVKFLLSESNCSRLISYLSDFERLGVYRRYGFKHRPRFAEGSEAASFAVSFLDVAGLLSQDLEESWSLRYLLPLEFSGSPITEVRINPLSFILQAHWGDDPSRGNEITIWDISRIYRWAQHRMSPGDSEVVIDKRHFPAPMEDIWRRELEDKASNVRLDP